MYRKLSVLVLAAALLALALGLSGETATAQEGVTPLLVEQAVTGELTAAAPIAVYSFNAFESLRMAVVFDILAGDMQVTAVVLGQDQSTLLAGSTGPAAEGFVVQFPQQGTYYVGLQGEGGTSATYRLMIDADPAQPLNEFVLMSYLAAGTSSQCSESTPTTSFTTTEDLNVCFALDLLGDPATLDVEWWSPSSEVVLESQVDISSNDVGTLFLTGIAYQDQPWTTGWWQVHFLINGELVYIQWVPVR
jgi:hypothetical protein